MPRLSFPIQAQAWRLLCSSVRGLLGESPDEARHLAPVRDDLEATLAEATARKNRLKKLEAETRFEAQKLRETIARGKGIASRLCSGLKALHGSSSPKLVRYGIKPLPGPKRLVVPDIASPRLPGVLPLDLSDAAEEAAAPANAPALESADEAPDAPES